jgi:hypothetical protein
VEMNMRLDSKENVEKYIHEQFDIILEDILFEVTQQTDMTFDDIKVIIKEQLTNLGYGHES